MQGCEPIPLATTAASPSKWRPLGAGPTMFRCVKKLNPADTRNHIPQYGIWLKSPFWGLERSGGS